MEESLRKYQQFIDGLVGISESPEANRVREGKWFEEWRNHRLIQELAPEQREVLAEMLEKARIATIHQVLVIMFEQEYRLVKENVELAFEPYGTEYFFDYIARVDKAPWPGVDGTVE